MSQWLGAAKLFEENSHDGSFFEAQSSIYALKQIRSAFDGTFPQMIFLLGEPGSGKSFLLNYLAKYYKKNKECLVIGNPYLTPIELLNKMITFVGQEPVSQDVESLREQAIEIYTDRDHIIMIDEAQLTHPPLREFIRILSDSKVFWFLIAMHTQEGESLLRSPHFYSRPHKVIYMGHLQLHECQPYLQKTLQHSQMWDFIMRMGNKLIQKSWEYAHGNFRNFKKLYYHLFLLLDFANENNKKEFFKPNAKLLKMAAIKAGLVADKKGVQNFDELALCVKSDSNSKVLKIAGVACLFLVLGIGVWYFQDIFFKGLSQTSEISAKEVDKNESTVALHVKPNIKEQIATKKIEVKSEQKTISRLESKKELTKQVSSGAKNLTFYPPNFDETKIVKTSSYKTKKIALPEEEEVVLEYKAMVEEEEPNFLDSQLEEEVPRRKGPILEVKSAKPKDVKTLIRHFLNSPTYKDALRIANIYYDKKDYKNATSWAKKANQLDREQEEAWILFAKSQYANGNRKDAKAVLKLFLDYKASQKAQLLLDRWEG